MDPHSTTARRRALAALNALLAAQTAMRRATASPGTAGTTYTAGADSNRKLVAISLPELHQVLRLAGPRVRLKADKRRHLVVQESLEMAIERMGQITARQPTREAVAALQLAQRQITAWLAWAAKQPASTATPAVSIGSLLRQKNAGYRFVPPPETAPPAQQIQPAGQFHSPEELNRLVAATKAANSKKRRAHLAARTAVKEAAERRIAADTAPNVTRLPRRNDQTQATPIPAAPAAPVARGRARRTPAA